MMIGRMMTCCFRTLDEYEKDLRAKRGRGSAVVCPDQERRGDGGMMMMMTDCDLSGE